jgi:hypothetical protein
MYLAEAEVIYGNRLTDRQTGRKMGRHDEVNRHFCDYAKASENQKERYNVRRKNRRKEYIRK